MKQAIQFCWSNFDSLISIFLAVAAVWFSLVGTKTELAIAATATILAVVAFGQMRDRAARRGLADDVKRVEKLIDDLMKGPRPDLFFAKGTSEKELLIRADRELLLIQETGRLIAETCRRELVTFLQRGGRLRWICTLDDPSVVQMMALRNKNLVQSQLIASRMAEGAKMIQVLANESGQSSSNMEVRFLPYPPDITCVIADPSHGDKNRREAMIRLQGFQLTFDDKMSFRIDARSSPNTFELYRSQAEAMWRSSTKCIFLTGRPRIGKSTILAEVVDDLRNTELEMAGFLTKDVRNSAGDRVGFDTTALDGSLSGSLARKGGDGEYEIDMSTMENIVLATLEKALEKPPQLLVVDEIGPLQLQHPKFEKLIRAIMDVRSITLLGVVAQVGHTFLSHVQQFYRTGIWVVSDTNRDELKAQLIEEFAPRSHR